MLNCLLANMSLLYVHSSHSAELSFDRKMKSQ